MEIANAVGATPGANNRAARVMMEGVGARIIRGPDWKWGKQVRNFPHLQLAQISRLIPVFRMGAKVT